MLTSFKIDDFTKAQITNPAEVKFQYGEVTAASYSAIPKVFIFPGLGGDDRELAALRLGCGPKLLCIPVRFPSWTDHGLVLTLDQLIDHCRAQIESIAPAGNIRLAGYSFGGTMAYAVAEALTAAGRRVDRLGLVEAPSSSHVCAVPLSSKVRCRRWAAAIREGTIAEQVARTIVGIVMRLGNPRLLVALGRLRRFNLPFGMQEHLNGHITCRLREHLLVDLIERMQASRPRLDVPAVLFRSTQQTDVDVALDLGWSGHLSALQIINLPGDHHTVIKPENIATLCDAFIRAMADPEGSA